MKDFLSSPTKVLFSLTIILLIIGTLMQPLLFAFIFSIMLSGIMLIYISNCVIEDKWMRVNEFLRTL